jgi:hypothetical protein
VRSDARGVEGWNPRSAKRQRSVAPRRNSPRSAVAVPHPLVFKPPVLLEALASRAVVPIATRVVHRDRVAAAVAHEEVATERSRSAANDRSQNLVLSRRERVPLPQRVAVSARDVAYQHALAGRGGAAWALRFGVHVSLAENAPLFGTEHLHGTGQGMPPRSERRGYRTVLLIERCPSRTWALQMSTPSSSECVA